VKLKRRAGERLAGAIAVEAPGSGGPRLTSARRSGALSIPLGIYCLTPERNLGTGWFRGRCHFLLKSYRTEKYGAKAETAESARRVGSCRGGPGHWRLWRGLVPAASHRSRPASPSDRRSAPPLCGHALVARAPHGRAYQPFQCRSRRPEPPAGPWRVVRFQSPAPIVF